MDIHIEINYIPRENANCVTHYLFEHSGRWIGELASNPIRVDSIGEGRALVTFPAIAEVDMKEFMTALEEGA